MTCTNLVFNCLRACIARVALALFVGIAGLSLSPWVLAQTKVSQAAEPLKAAFVYVGPANLPGWSHQHELGRRQMQDALGSKVLSSFVENVAEGADAERVIRDLAQNGHQLIVATSFGYANAIEKVSKEFPQVSFMHVSGYKTYSNLGNVNARFYEARYVLGMVAAKTSKTGQLGYVAGFPIPEVLQGINAFALGARAVNPKAKVRTVFVNTWFDPIKERDAAHALIAQTVDVLTYHTGSTAVPQAAQEKGVRVMGYHSDISTVVPKANVVAATHHWGGFYTKLANDVLSGQWKPSELWSGMSGGFVKLSGWNADVSADLKKLVQAVEGEISTGKRHPFQGPIADQDGIQKLRVGTRISDAELKSMNYFVQGVVGVLPKN